MSNVSTSIRLDLQDAQSKLKEEQKVMIDKEQQFEKELAVAQKLVNLHKIHCDKRTADAAELENVVRDLRKHVEVARREGLEISNKPPREHDTDTVISRLYSLSKIQFLLLQLTFGNIDRKFCMSPSLQQAYQSLMHKFAYLMMQ